MKIYVKYILDNGQGCLGLFHMKFFPLWSCFSDKGFNRVLPPHCGLSKRFAFGKLCLDAVSSLFTFSQSLMISIENLK
jgi:hypothetical protein